MRAFAEVETKTFVAFIEDGVFFLDESGTEVQRRNPQRHARRAPKHVYALCYYDVVVCEVKVGDESVGTTSEPRNISHYYYIDATVLDRDDVKRLPGNYKIFLINMVNNGYEHAVMCRNGKLIPVKPGEYELVSTR